MSPNVRGVLAAATSLSVEERLDLIELLVAGLGDSPPDEQAPTTLSEAWRQGIVRRSAEFDAGRAHTVCWEKVRTRWHARRQQRS